MDEETMKEEFKKHVNEIFKRKTTERPKEMLEIEFGELVAELTDDEFWAYAKKWFDEDLILDVMNKWDIETKKGAISELNAIIEKRKYRKYKTWME